MRVGCCLAVVALVVLPLGLSAAESTNAPAATGYIEKFEIPDRDEQGNLRWKLMGERAKIGADGVLTILSMRAEFYQSNQVQMVFSAPTCTLDQQHRKATTDAPVRIESDKIIVTGDGADWASDQASFLVRSNVHVVIKGDRLPAPAATPVPASIPVTEPAAALPVPETHP